MMLSLQLLYISIFLSILKLIKPISTLLDSSTITLTRQIFKWAVKEVGTGQNILLIALMVEIDLFILNGPKISEVVQRYTDLTGKSAFSPMESLGYLGSTMFYVELPERCDHEILDFVDKNLDENIPISNFHLSSGYTML